MSSEETIRFEGAEPHDLVFDALDHAPAGRRIQRHRLFGENLKSRFPDLFTRSLGRNGRDQRQIQTVEQLGVGMLLYGLLHLSGYDLPIDELRNFRQLGLDGNN